MRYLPNGKQMSEADAHTIHEIGIPSLVLMERAALQIVETMHKKNISTEKSLIVCGSGNNGGDGFAVARLLTEQGKHADVLFVGKEDLIIITSGASTVYTLQSSCGRCCPLHFLIDTLI